MAKSKSPRPRKAAAARSVTRRKRAADPIPAVPDAERTQVVVTDDDIRVRAYFLSIEHRGQNLNDVDFWLIAERELRNGTNAGR